MPWTTEQKIFTVGAYFRQKSIHAAQLQFKERFGCREFPVHSMIYRWVNKFRTNGTVHKLNRKDTNRQSHSGRPKSSRTPHNVAAVRDSVVHSPSKSVRRRSQELGINRESVRRILIADLHMYPYRIQIKQKLTPDDMRKPVIMYQWFCDKIDAVPDFLDNAWFSDEAHFLLSGHVDSKNNIFWWDSTPPEPCLPRPLHSVKCTAWIAVSKHGITGPFWFEDDNERSVTINTERYVQVLGKFWTALGRRRGVFGALQWFQQDGATPTPQTNHWHGYSSVSLTDRSAAGVTRSGRRIHRTWRPQIFICGDTLRTGCIATIPRLSLTWTPQSQQQ